MLEARMILFALHEMEGIGWKTINKIVRRFDDLTELRQQSAKSLEILHIKPGKAQLIAHKLAGIEHFISTRLTAYERSGVTILTHLDDTYPELLKQSSQAPWVLYCKGNLELLKQPQIAMVGTRVPTSYGKKVAFDLAGDLTKAGFCVVSGMARGIDSAAHRGALKEKGSTIAVLGCGADVIYPAENESLYHEMIESGNGLILSEYVLGTTAFPGLFPMRNRIIAGLSLGTIVVEAALQSGSLITADQALDESRDVFAIPGPINSPKSQGTLTLIKRGAKLVTCVEDICEEYKHLIPFASEVSQYSLQSQTPLSADEQQIYAMLSSEPTSIDQLLEQCQTNFGHLHAILLSLLMKKVIEQLPGSTYIIL